jgi:hypothetical protein
MPKMNLQDTAKADGKRFVKAGLIRPMTTYFRTGENINIVSPEPPKPAAKIDISTAKKRKIVIESDSDSETPVPFHLHRFL